MKVRIGGVPEHFNLPWHLAFEQGIFKNAGIELEWIDFPGGTGAMSEALENGSIDLGVLLTEGVIAAILKGNPSKLVQAYIDSPLKWGIYTGGNSKANSVNEITNRKYAISRYGSGSHLMAVVNADQRKWKQDSISFEVVGGLEGAKKALNDGSAELFMWEKFTTQPFVDEGIFKLIGVCPTPWPCFAIASSTSFIDKHPEELKSVLNIIKQSSVDFMARLDAVPLIAERYKLDIDEAKEWFEATDWTHSNNFDRNVLMNIVDTLFNLGLIPEKRQAEFFCHNSIRLQES